MISIYFGYDIDSYGYGTTIQMLTLKMYTPKTKSSSGRARFQAPRRTDRDSHDLKKAIERVLAKFPPHRNW